MPINQTQPSVPGISTGANSPEMIVHPSVLVDTSDNAFGVPTNPIFIGQTAQSGYVTANAANLAHTTATTDYSFSWGTGSTVVNHLMIYNGTAADVQWETDLTANAGSPVLATKQYLFLDVQCTVLHLFTAAQQNVNGASSGNIVVRAWM